IRASHPAQHDIAIKGLLHLMRAEEQVVTAILGNQKTEAIAITLHTPLDQIHLLHQAEHATTIADQLPIPAHGYQPPAQSLLQLFIQQLQLNAKLLMSGRTRPLLQMTENKLAAGN